MHATVTEKPRPRKLVQQARVFGTCAVCGKKLRLRDGREPDPPTCARNGLFDTPGATCAHTYRAVQLARLIAREPGLSRRQIAERLGYSERHAQALINWLREAEPEVLIVATGRLAKEHGYRFLFREVVRIEVDGEVVPT